MKKQLQSGLQPHHNKQSAVNIKHASQLSLPLGGRRSAEGVKDDLPIRQTALNFLNYEHY